MLSSSRGPWTRAFLLITMLIAATFGTVPDADARDTKFSTGICTIGDGNTTSGVFNITDSGMESNPKKVLQRAVEFSNRVHFLKGTYTFTEPFVSGRSNIEISADPGTTFISSGTNAVSWLDLSGDDVTVRGISFVWSVWVDSQVGVRFKQSAAAPSKRAKLLDCKFSVAPSVQFYTDHDDATPMIFAHFDTVVAKWVERCMFFPQSGVTCVRTDNGNGFRFMNSEISNWTDGGFPELAVFADMYRGLDMRGEEWAFIQNSKFWAVGNYTLGIEPDACIRYDGSTTGNEEFGHLVITGCIIENVNTPRPIYLISPQWFNISANLIGPNFAAVNADGEAAIKIVGSNATATTVTTIVQSTKTFTFTGTNPALSTGESFYLATTGLADARNARTFTAASASTGSGPWTVVVNETPAADETAITGVAYVATSGSIGPKKAWAGIIAANDIHNSVGQGTAGAALYAEHTEKLSVFANHFNLQRGTRMCKFDTPTVMDLTFSGNACSFYETSSLNPTSVLVFTNGVANRVGITANTYVGDPAFITGTVTGSYWFPYGLQEQAADGGGDTTLTPESGDTAEQLTTNLNLNNG